MGSSKEEKCRHSIEEALHAVDEMAIVDDDNIIDSDGIDVGSTLLSTKSMLPTFNSKGSFTGYDKRKIKNEISSKLESSQYVSDSIYISCQICYISLVLTHMICHYVTYLRGSTMTNIRKRRK